jgi:hypothetical protein
MLRHIGYEEYANILVYMSFLPLILSLTLFWTKRDNTSRNKAKKNISGIPLLLKVIVIFFSIFLNVFICNQLPFADIGFFQLKTRHPKDFEIIKKIEIESMIDLHLQSLSGKGARVYFNNTTKKNEKILEGLFKQYGIQLTEQNVDL